MSVLWIVVAVVGVFFVLIVCGAILSTRRSMHDKKLRNSADYAFKTKKGKYSFLYLIKGFKREDGKLIKVAIHPFLGFSDLVDFNTNGCKTIYIFCKDRKTGEEIEVCDEINTPPSDMEIDIVSKKDEEINAQQNGLQINSEVLIPSKFLDESGIADLEVKIRGSWKLGGDDISDEFTFDFKK